MADDTYIPGGGRKLKKIENPDDDDGQHNNLRYTVDQDKEEREAQVYDEFTVVNENSNKVKFPQVDSNWGKDVENAVAIMNDDDKPLPGGFTPEDGVPGFITPEDKSLKLKAFNEEENRLASNQEINNNVSKNKKTKNFCPNCGEDLRD